MELIHTPIHNDTKASAMVSFKHYLLAFINRNADTFEALARSATPFGGSCLPVRHYGVKDEPDGRNWQPAGSAVTPTAGLSKRTSSLSGKVTGTPLASWLPVSKNAIGINRFRSLNARS